MVVSRQHAEASADPSSGRWHPEEGGPTRAPGDPSGARLVALQQLAHRLGRCGDRAAIAKAVVDACFETLHADGAALSALGPAGALALLHARGDVVLGAHAAVRGGLAEWTLGADALAARTPAWLECEREVEAADPELMRAAAQIHQAAALVPLVADDRAVGLLELSFREPRRFDARERAHVAAIADAGARALDAARLREDLARVRARLRAAQQLTVGLTAAATPDDVADALSHAALAATGACTASVSWHQDDGGLTLVQSAGGGCRHPPGVGGASPATRACRSPRPRRAARRCGPRARRPCRS
jgi:GAF domain-containing protein